MKLEIEKPGFKLFLEIDDAVIGECEPSAIKYSDKCLNEHLNVQVNEYKPVKTVPVTTPEQVAKIAKNVVSPPVKTTPSPHPKPQNKPVARTPSAKQMEVAMGNETRKCEDCGAGMNVPKTSKRKICNSCRAGRASAVARKNYAEKKRRGVPET